MPSSRTCQWKVADKNWVDFTANLRDTSFVVRFTAVTAFVQGYDRFIVSIEGNSLSYFLERNVGSFCVLGRDERLGYSLCTALQTLKYRWGNLLIYKPTSYLAGLESSEMSVPVKQALLMRKGRQICVRPEASSGKDTVNIGMQGKENQCSARPQGDN